MIIYLIKIYCMNPKLFMIQLFYLLGIARIMRLLTCLDNLDIVVFNLPVLFPRRDEKHHT